MDIKSKFLKGVNFLLIGLIVTSLTICMAGSTSAQETSEETGDEEFTLEEIVITGSRISRKDYVSPSPLVTTKMEAITVSGKPSVDDYLKELPQFAPGTGDYSNDSNGGTAGRATVNLRNLGAKRNLVLMNGRRLMSSGTDGAIDINTIPSLAIGDIEVITGGASATYGSDALSGVVNFKTRTDVDGFEFDAQMSSLDDSGEDSYKFGAVFGTDYGDDKGNLLLSLEHNNRGGVHFREREFFMVHPQASSFIVYGFARNRANTWTLDNSGNLFDSSDIDDPSTGLFTESIQEPLLIRGDDLRTIGAWNNYIQVPLEQTTFFGQTDYEFDNGIKAYGQLLYASSTAYNEGAAPISAGIWGVIIPADNYYLQQSPALVAALPPGDVTGFQQRFAQAGGRVYNTENDVVQALGGFSGTIGDRDLNWDVHVSFGKTDTSDNTISGSVNFAAVQEILDSTDPLTGVSPLCSGGYNPFGGTDPLSADCLAYVSRTPVNETTLEQTVIEGLLEGKLADLPAGEARFALNAQYRENTYEYNPDPDIAAGELANLASSAYTRGEIDAIEVAGEALLPLISDGNVIDSLNLTLGLRFSDYDPAGSNETYKVEFDAQVTDSLMFRGSIQHAVRAPNVEEFFRASLLRVQPFLDPCSSRYRGVSLDRAAELALCAVQGADPRYAQGGSSAPTITNGNPDLVPEEADTFTLGAVYERELGKGGIQLTLDYYNIEVDQAIEVLSAQQIMTKCFNLDGLSNPTYDNNHFACQQLNRPIYAPATTSFDLDPVNQPILNLGGIKTAGYDFTLNYYRPVDALSWGGGTGGITFRSLVNILDKHEIQAFNDEPFVDFAGLVSNNVVYPELKVFTSLSVETGPVIATATWRHFASMDDISAAGGVATTIEGADSYDYFDFTGRVNIGDNFQVYGGINNIADKKPPQLGGSAIAGEADSGTNQGTYDAIGRSFYLGLRFVW